MHLTFTPSRSKLVHKLADVTIHFDEGFLKGFSLVGIEVWHQRDDPNIRYVTLPKRQLLRRDNSVSRFTLLRTSTPTYDRAATQALLDAILAEYADWAPTDGDEPSMGTH